MTAVTTPSPSELSSRLGAVLTAAEAELSAAGQGSRVEQLQLARSRPLDTAPMVVVVGEAKSGKSSLVNALIGRPGLSPVGADITTGAWVSFCYFRTEMAAVALVGEQTPHSITLEEIPQWASVTENPGNAKGVQSVAVALDCPLLQGLTLVDTPGVGGLDHGHGALALQAMAGADALLFALDPDNPLSEPEWRFLSEAAERIDTVIIVLTKKDGYREWETRLSENAALLAAHAPGLARAPMVAVSSLLAQEARQLNDDPELLAESGLPALETVLERVVAGRAATLRLANLVRFADSALKQLARATKERIAALDGVPAVQDALQEDKERLAQFRRGQAEWRADLDVALRQINLDRTDDLASAIAELQMQYESRANAAGAEELGALPGQLIDDLAALADRVSTATTEKIRSAVSEIVGELEEHHSALAIALGRGIETPDVDSALLATPVRRGTTELDRLRMAQTWSSGRSIGGYLAALPMFAIGGIPLLIISFVGATVFAWKSHQGYQLLTLQGDFRAWAARQLGVAQTRLNNGFNRRMIPLQRELTKAIGQFVDDREKLVLARIAAYEEANRGDAETRRRERAAAEQRLERVDALRLQASQVLGELRSSDA